MAKLECTTGRVCWADLLDDQTTNPGDSPRSMSSSCHDGCQDQPPLRRTLWADMVDCDSECVEEALDPTDDSTVAASSSTPSQVLLHLLKFNVDRTMVDERGTLRDEFDVSADRSRGTESVERVQTFVQANIEKHDMSRTKTVGCSGKGLPNNTCNDAKKVGSKGSGKRATQKRAGKGGDKGAGKGASNGKFQCQFILGIEEDRKFRVVKRVIGTGGENMKRIATESGAKLRLRGRGSRFLEGREQKESDDDLMLCVSALDATAFETARRAVSELIEGIHRDYHTFWWNADYAYPDLELKIHDGYRAGSH